MILTALVFFVAGTIVFSVARKFTAAALCLAMVLLLAGVDMISSF